MKLSVASVASGSGIPRRRFGGGGVGGGGVGVGGGSVRCSCGVEAFVVFR